MLEKLLEEHNHLRQVLNLLERYCLDLCRDSDVDLSLMMSIVVYTQEYPERVHHPLEDAAFSKLLEYDSESRDLIRALMQDHTELERITRSLRDALETFIALKVFNKNQLLMELMTFLSRQRQHLLTEEARVYPLLRRYLTTDDWQELGAGIGGIDDPIFGNRERTEYKLLYEQLTQ